MIYQQLQKDLLATVKKLGLAATDPLLSIPENEDFGDYSTNIALQQSNQKLVKSYQSPKEIANAIVEKLGHPVYLERVDIAGPGFINFYIKDQFLVKNLTEDVKRGTENRNILVEF